MKTYKWVLIFFLTFISIGLIVYLVLIFTIKNYFYEISNFFISISLIIIIGSLIPIIIGVLAKHIDNKSRRVVKINIDKLSNGSPIFKCGYCGETDSFLIPFSSMNLFQCSNCRRYNIFEEQVNNI